jgi:hypothetical protein
MKENCSHVFESHSLVARDRITFEELHRRICDALRGNRSPVVAEVFLPDGSRKIIRGRKQQ